MASTARGAPQGAQGTLHGEHMAKMTSMEHERRVLRVPKGSTHQSLLRAASIGAFAGGA